MKKTGIFCESEKEKSERKTPERRIAVRLAGDERFMKSKILVQTAAFALAQSLTGICAYAAGSVPAPDTGNVSPAAYVVPAVIFAVSVLAGKKGKKK